MATPKITIPPSYQNKLIEDIISTLEKLKTIEEGSDTEQLRKALKHVVPMTPPNTTYNFNDDSQFLNTSITHHINNCLNNVIIPLVKFHHNRLATGRLLTDNDIDKYSKQVTTEIIRETGENYRTYMFKYFNDDAGFIAYVYNRVFTMLSNKAIEYNEVHLTNLARRNGSNRLVEITSSQPE